MRMFMTVVALILMMGSASASTWVKDKNWQGPGWYLTISTAYASSIEKGPFSTETACKAAMPSEAEQKEMFDAIGAQYDCKNLKPDGARS